MNNYIIHFVTYTFAMAGFIAMLLFVYKKAIMPSTGNRTKKFLKVESTLRIAPTKTIYVLQAGNERFLIAGDAANTTMLAKLDENNIEITEEAPTEIPKFSALKETIQKAGRG